MSAAPEETPWQPLATLDELAAKRRLVRVLDGLSVLLLQVGDGVIAVHNACPHLGKPLEAGRVFAGQLTCPFHSACFDLKTGAAVSGPAVVPLHRFPVRVRDGAIEVQLLRPRAGYPPTMR